MNALYLLFYFYHPFHLVKTSWPKPPFPKFWQYFQLKKITQSFFFVTRQIFLQHHFVLYTYLCKLRVKSDYYNSKDSLKCLRSDSVKPTFFVIGFRIFRSNLFTVSVHFWTSIFAWFDLNLLLRIVSNFKTYQFTLDKQMNITIFSTNDTPP